MKGFNAKVISRHLDYDIGETVYMKAIGFKFSTPTLYAVLERENGKVTGYVDANEFKNRFERVRNNAG